MSYCSNCGAQLPQGVKFCINCGTQVVEPQVEKVEPQVEKVEPEFVGAAPQTEGHYTEPNYNYNGGNYSAPVYSDNQPPYQQKSSLAAGLLGIFLGMFGVHNFYLGYTGKAIAQLLITVLSFFVLSGVSAIWGFIEGILILAGSIKVDGKGYPISKD